MDSRSSPDDSLNETRAKASARSGRFLISIDDAGQFLLVPAGEVRVGHLQSAWADLPFLADLEEQHACFQRRESLRAGSVWWLRAMRGASGVCPVACNGEPVATERPLKTGDQLRIGNVGMEFRLPDAASQTALLELKQGIECCGAQHVLMMAEGSAGRIRIGPASHGHIRLPQLSTELLLGLEGDELTVCAIEVEGGDERELVTCRIPPRAWSHVPVERSVQGRPPFTLGFGPAEPASVPPLHPEDSSGEPSSPGADRQGA